MTAILLSPSVFDVLVETRKILTNPHNHTKKCFARNARSQFRKPTDTDAVKFDLIGAVMKACGVSNYWGSSDPVFKSVIERLTKLLPPDTHITNYNDTHSHSEIINLINTAVDTECVSLGVCKNFYGN